MHKVGVKKRSFQNNFSLIFGVLCFVVVYLHSSWAEGFDIYTVGLNSPIVKKIVSLLLMTAVPSFFMMWGYLSNKYFQSDESVTLFLKKKICQFYPIYLVFFLINICYRWDQVSQFPLWKLLLSGLGLYYTSGMGGGGHIYMVALFVVLTISLIRYVKLTNKFFLFIFCFCCLIITKYIPHESSNCYLMYFGYYAAFFFGVTLKYFNVFESRSSSPFKVTGIEIFLCFIGTITPILNYLGIYVVEVEYNPNSPEQLLFCFLFIFIANKIVTILRLPKRKYFLFTILNRVGNNAYGHFIIHTLVIHFFVAIKGVFFLNAVLVQIAIILLTSVITVYWILPIYQLAEQRWKMKVAEYMY